MFVPPSFVITDESILFDCINANGFAALVTATDGVPTATHLPMLLDRDRRVLVGHVARANPHWKVLEATVSALAIFTGPHGYVSPSWYATHPAVPTWNYTAVHVTGRPRVFHDLDAIGVVLDRLVRQYEATLPTPWTGDLPEDYRDRMLRAVVGVEVSIERVEGAFKLNQNRSEMDRAGVVRNLETSGGTGAMELARFMRAKLNIENETGGTRPPVR